MNNVCISFFGSDETFKLLGNKATSSDIEFRHYSKGGKVISFVKPLNDKIKTIIQCVNLSDFVVIELKEINRQLGELILLLDLLNKQGLFIIDFNKQFIIEQVKGLTKNTNLSNFEFKIINNNEDIKLLKEQLIKINSSFLSDSLIILDHAFTVKSVGTVALGFIKGGIIKVKDKFKLLPVNKEVQINSMQSMDVNYKELSIPARVGVSLKNCNLSDLERGSVLSKVLEQVNDVSGKLIKSRFFKDELSSFMIINGLIARQASIVDGKVRVNKPIVITSDSIIFDENKNPRILGIIKYG